MVVRIYTSSGRLTPAAIGLGVILIGIGGAVLLSGLALLLVLGAAATTVAAGAVLFRRLTGRPAPSMAARRSAHGLDPALEVFPDALSDGAPSRERHPTLSPPPGE